MFHSLIISNNYLTLFAKNINFFIDAKSLIQFLLLWFRIKKHYLEILAYL